MSHSASANSRVVTLPGKVTRPVLAKPVFPDEALSCSCGSKVIIARIAGLFCMSCGANVSPYKRLEKM